MYTTSKYQIDDNPTPHDPATRYTGEMKYVMKVSFLALCAMIPSVGATRASLVEDKCQYNTYMCCWTENDNGVEDNADICAVNDVNQPGDEKVHCHGMVWADDAHFESFILPLYKFVRTFDHRDARGYYGRSVSKHRLCELKLTLLLVFDCATFSFRRSRTRFFLDT